MTGDEIRDAFLEFFADKGHKVMASSSLIPSGDPTLLLTSAGMVPFKPYYLGEELPPNRRLTSCQKCFRTTDIEAVGDPHHLTFFEMLGNFSIGDYFKREAIDWAWEFVTRNLALTPSRLWITIFHDDEESFGYWRETGVPEERILRFGEKDNFWGPAGNSGPCGPCSEIHYDLGPEVGCQRPSCAPGCDCGRFSEIWNLVFTQYNQDESGKRTLLPKPNIDTGMGLERAAAALQGKGSVYETDLFLPLLECVSALAGKRYGAESEADNAMRIVAEHGRGITFLIADGVLPANEGRGYVLRRLLRRAQYFSQALAPDTPFIVEVVKTVIDNMGGTYPELVASRDKALKIIESEIENFQGRLLVSSARLTQILMAFREELVDYFPKFEKNFKQVLSEHDIIELSSKIGVAVDHFLRDCGAWEHYLRVAGRDAVEETLKPIEDGLVALKKAASHYDGTQPNAFVGLKRHLWSLFEGVKKSVKEVATKLSGYEVFILHDTYGLPVEITKDIAAEHGLSIDLEGFEREMEKQQERARAAQKLDSGKVEAGPIKLTLPPRAFNFTLPKIQFVGYDYGNLIYKTVIVGLSNYDPTDKESKPTLREGQEAAIILGSTPFYGEMGGQLGDTGEIVGPKGRFLVTNTVRGPQDIIIHQGKVTEGSLTVEDEVEAVVDRERRLDIARNHTATHLLQLALRQVLGEHVEQRGSLVAPERLRFDFSHLEALTGEEIRRVSHIVNDTIRRNLPVYGQLTSYKQAVAEGATALFGEKYGDEVRVVKIGETAVSAELCGGTHVASTGELGLFQITSEGGIGTGLRRIEAVTGRGAEEYVTTQLTSLHNIAESLKTSPSELEDKVMELAAELDGERRRALNLERELAHKVAASLASQAEVVNGVKVLAARVPSCRLETLRETSDQLREQLKSAVIVLGTIHNNKPLFLAAVTPDLAERGYHAGEIVNRVAGVAGGRGGGKARFAQAGGKYPEKLDEALRLVRDFIQGGGQHHAQPGS